MLLEKRKHILLKKGDLAGILQEDLGKFSKILPGHESRDLAKKQSVF
jgi:hypothetical protein